VLLQKFFRESHCELAPEWLATKNSAWFVTMQEENAKSDSENVVWKENRDRHDPLIFCYAGNTSPPATSPACVHSFVLPPLPR